MTERRIEEDQRHLRRHQRSVPTTIAAAAQIAGHLVAPWRRPQRLRWGARADEPEASLPGEDLIADPNWSYTHAIDIDASVEDVWPWIAQLGQGRGGFYSYERLENLFGCRVTNTDRILPAHQHPAVGDEFRLHPTAPPMHVAVVDAPRALVLRGAPHGEASPDTDNIWAFHLRDTGDGTCRLIERGATRHGTSLRDRLFFSAVVVEPIGFVMSREMLSGIKQRAEQHRARADEPTRPGARRVDRDPVIDAQERETVEAPWHPFRSSEARAEYLAFYDERAQGWPVASESRMVATSFGDTFVREQGPADGPPMVLVPGDRESSRSWMPVIDAFASEHRVYAPDHINDLGRSICRREPRRPGDFVRWLDELFDELEVHDVRLVAHSYGAWQAALYALEHPERLDKVVLLSPAATVLRPRVGLLARAIFYGTFPRRPVVQRYLYWYAPDCVRDEATRPVIDEMIEEDLLARRCFTPRTFVLPTRLSDEDWRRLAVPSLYLVGRNEVTYSAERAIQRLATVAPHVRTAITDGDHHLTITQPDWVIEQVTGFLQDPTATPPRPDRATTVRSKRRRDPSPRPEDPARR